MSRETYLNVLVNAPRKLQLNSIALRWHQLLVKTLSDTVENMTIVQIKEDYRLHATTQPREYNSLELKQLEANREFILQPLPARDTESVLALVSDRCAKGIHPKWQKGNRVPEPDHRTSVQNLWVYIRFWHRVTDDQTW